MKQWLWAINSSGLGLYLVGLAFLGGLSIVADWDRADPGRTAVLSKCVQPVEQELPNVVKKEPMAPAKRLSNNAPWTTHFQRADTALALKDVGSVEEAGYEASDAPLRSRC